MQKGNWWERGSEIENQKSILIQVSISCEEKKEVKKKRGGNEGNFGKSLTKEREKRMALGVVKEERGRRRRQKVARREIADNRKKKKKKRKGKWQQWEEIITKVTPVTNNNRWYIKTHLLHILKVK